MVHDPREYPGVCKRQVVTLDGRVLETQYVLNTSPLNSSAMWYPLYPGAVVVYPNDPSTNMLQVQSGQDFLRWHDDTALADEVFEAEFGEYPGLYDEGERV